MKIEMMDIDRVIPYARNPRKNVDAVDKVAASLREFGFRQPIVTDENLTVIVGHTRLAAAKKLNLSQVPVHVAEGLTDAQIKAYRIADNRTNEEAEWDFGALKIELEDLKDAGADLASTAFDSDELAKFLAETTEGLVDEDATPEVSVEPRSRLGDIWILGRHRIMCGDCKSLTDLEKIFQGRQINLVVTSPPYASQREYDKSSKFEPIHPNEYVSWYQEIASNIFLNLAEDGSYFLNIKPNAEGLKRELYVFDLVLAHVREWGWNFAEEFCWERAGIPQQVSRRFKNQFEPIYHFTRGEWKFRPDDVKHKSKAVPKARGKGAGNTNAALRQGHISAVDGNEIYEGMAYPGNRLPSFQSEALGHPAAYPVGLPEFFIKAYTDLGDLVFDPFTGSGSTLIAAEKNGRSFFGTEISPIYTDLIVKRWQDFTGKKAILESTDKEFDAVA